jgi:hypothetical protein
LKIDEVQEAMKLKKSLMEKKDEWMNQDFMMRLAQNPKLLQAF